MSGEKKHLAYKKKRICIFKLFGYAMNVSLISIFSDFVPTNYFKHLLNSLININWFENWAASITNVIFHLIFLRRCIRLRYGPYNLLLLSINSFLKFRYFGTYCSSILYFIWPFNFWLSRTSPMSLLWTKRQPGVQNLKSWYQRRNLFINFPSKRIWIFPVIKSPKQGFETYCFCSVLIIMSSDRQCRVTYCFSSVFFSVLILLYFQLFCPADFSEPMEPILS